MISANAMLHEQVDMVVGFPPGTPSTSTPDYVCMKNYERCSIVLLVDNGNTVTGSAITVKQATDVSNSASDEKAVAFSVAYRNLTAGSGTDSVLSSFDVTSDTFTTNATNAVNAIYVIDIKAEDLDIDDGFDCIRAGTGDAANTVIAVLYLLYPKKYSVPGTAITD